MSTIKVTNIEHGSTTDGGIQLDSSGHVTIDGQQLPTAGPLSNRNLIINGAMTVSQRGTSFTHGSSSQYTLDRFEAANGSSFNWNSAVITQSSDSPDGFANSLKVDVASTSSPTGSHNACFKHLIEAQNLQHLDFGSSGAKSFTLSFWVKSNKTGAYSVQVLASDADKYLLSEYTISSSNTWEKKTLTFVGNTADVIDNNNGAGFEVRFNLACGSSDITTAKSTWTAASGGTIHASTNQVNLFDDASNEWYLTGVQLEVGEKATPFEHRSYGDELARCQRYFLRLAAGNMFHGRMNGGGNMDVSYFYPVTPRTVPTGSASLDTANAEYGSIGITVNALSVNDTGSHAATIRAGLSSSGTNGHGAYLKITGDTTVDFSAEL